MSQSKVKVEQYHLHKNRPERLQFEAYSLKEYRKLSREKAVTPHSHSYYQIIWFFDGGGHHSVDFETYHIKKNTILFITKDQVHAFDENENTNGWLIHFNESFFMHSDVDIFLKYNIFNSRQNAYYVMDEETVRTSGAYLEIIQQELVKREQFGYEEIIRFLLKSLLINLERVYQKDSGKKLRLSSAYEAQFFRFKELVEDNFTKSLSITEYAELLNISSKTLTTITRKIVNKTPSSIVSERIILETKRLLKFTSLQIGEIAFRLGFEDDSYFIKYFKKHTGQLPLSFRNSNY